MKNCSRTGPTSIYHLWKVFDMLEVPVIVALKEKYRQNLNFLAATQNFDSKMSSFVNPFFFLAVDFFRVLIKFHIFQVQGN
jgi:cellulose synthase/poly-beta-1,6-N-acetylglucosamine synthase-like glycosyltransferase